MWTRVSIPRAFLYGKAQNPAHEEGMRFPAEFAYALL